jgi:hypothetical protein
MCLRRIIRSGIGQSQHFAGGCVGVASLAGVHWRVGKGTMPVERRSDVALNEEESWVSGVPGI